MMMPLPATNRFGLVHAPPENRGLDDVKAAESMLT